jgi:large subunit ribosomal protein L18
MNRNKLKTKRRDRRKARVRKRIYGTADCPRLTVTRSLQNTYAQLIDDDKGHTLVQITTLSKDMKSAVGYGGNKDAAVKVGKAVAEAALAKGIKQAVFDRNGYRYHGRVKALTDAVREGGLKL